MMTISLSGLVDILTALQNLAIWEEQNAHLLKGVNVDKSKKEPIKVLCEQTREVNKLVKRFFGLC